MLGREHAGVHVDLAVLRLHIEVDADDAVARQLAGEHLGARGGLGAAPRATSVRRTAAAPPHEATTRRVNIELQVIELERAGLRHQGGIDLLAEAQGQRGSEAGGYNDAAFSR